VDEEDLLLLLVACPYGMSACVCTEHMWPMNGAAWREQLPDQTILPFLLLLLLLPSTAAAAAVVDFNQDPADPFFFQRQRCSLQPVSFNHCCCRRPIFESINSTQS